jgi:hypothetical protein
MIFKWNRLLEAGAVVTIIALTLAPTQTRQYLLDFGAQGFPGDVQSFITLTAIPPSTALSTSLSQFSAANRASHLTSPATPLPQTAAHAK